MSELIEMSERPSRAAPQAPFVSRSTESRGAVAVIVGLLLVVLAGMAALAIDVGIAYDARRNAQAAVDIGLLSGAQDIPFGQQEASERIATEVRANLDIQYGDDEWTERWSTANCTDDKAFATLGVVGGHPTNCISFDDTGRVRVRLPDLEIPTVFGGVLGKDSFHISAGAIGWVRYSGIGGVLPFTVLGGAEDGSQICLRSASGGAAIPPCDGAASGNFHALQVSIYGDKAFKTDTIPCNTNDNDVFTINVAKGIDHLLRVWNGTGVTDSCSKPFGPNQFYTDTGLGNGLWEGLVAGETIQGIFFAGRLTNTTPLGDTIVIEHEDNHHVIDNTPLWRYIPSTLVNAPTSCLRGTFDGLSFTAATANIETCLTDYVTGTAAGSVYEPLFTEDGDGNGKLDIDDNPRFAIVPQTIETTLPRGRKVVRVSGFRAVWVQGLYFPTGGGATIVEAGESSPEVHVPNGGSPLDQVTGWLLPNNTVPSVIAPTDAEGGEVSGANIVELLE